MDAEARQLRAVRELARDPDSAEARKKLAAFFSAVLELRDETRFDGCTLSLVVLPFRFQLEPTAPQPELQQCIAGFCREQGIPCLDVLGALRVAGEWTFIDDSHLSFLGARIVAGELVRWGRTGCAQCGFDLAGDPDLACPRCGVLTETGPSLRCQAAIDRRRERASCGAARCGVEPRAAPSSSDGAAIRVIALPHARPTSRGLDRFAQRV